MTIVNFSTELSGGAGAFASNVHKALIGSGYSSRILSREISELEGSLAIKPLRKIAVSLRAKKLQLFNALGILDTSIPLFGIEKNPVGIKEVDMVLSDLYPTAFIFYWISYFVSFETIWRLKLKYPEANFVFVCTDEAFLTGGCHYSFGCEGFKRDCGNCPGLSRAEDKLLLKNKAAERREFLKKINPLIVYPTSLMKRSGDMSFMSSGLANSVLPLGAVSRAEQSKYKKNNEANSVDSKSIPRKAVLLVRSSEEHRKGCDLLVAALRCLKLNAPDVLNAIKIVTFGDSFLHDSNINQIVDYTHVGYLGRVELLSLYSKVDALIVTSRVDAGPIVINEAVALNLFVLSTPVGVARDLLINGANGYIAEDFSVSSLSSTLDSFVKRFRSNKNLILDKGMELQARGLSFEGFVERLLDSFEHKPKF